MNDPAFYDRMSKLLEEIIAALKAKRIDYEEYLKRIAEIAKHVQSGEADDTPELMRNRPGLRAIYNNLKLPREKVQGGAVREQPPTDGAAGDPAFDLAVRIDVAVKRARPDGWRGVLAREQVIKSALYGILKDEALVERIFLVIKQQSEY